MSSSDARSSITTSDPCWRSVSLGLLVANLIWSIVLEAGILQSSGSLRSILAGFEARQGWLTTLALSRGFLWIVPVMVIMALIKERAISCPRRRLLVNFAHLYLILIVQAVYSMGIFAPLLDLLHRLS